ncbi:MAG: hypothetical protein LKK44_03850 [Atopobiaceae bacterium]|nr:hypothetical protein [Atopobiaceae bacterium]
MSPPWAGNVADAIARTSVRTELLVGDTSLRRPSESCRFHVWSDSLPAGALCRLDEDVLVTSPEFTLVQLAPLVDEMTLLGYAYELCGCFVPLTEGLANRRPLMCAEGLRRMVGSLPACRGVRSMRLCAEYARDRAASPKEALLGQLLALPRRLGGAGLGGLELNASVDVGPGLYVDVSWPGSDLVLEYESYEVHLDKRVFAHDSMRRALLREAGHEVITVTWEQLRNPAEMERIINIARDRIVPDERALGEGWRSRQRALMARLV